MASTFNSGFVWDHRYIVSEAKRLRTSSIRAVYAVLVKSNGRSHAATDLEVSSTLLTPARKPVLTMAGSRGCPYRCDYCSLIHTGGKTFRRRDPIKIADEYEYLVDRYGVKQIGFIDPIFPLVKKDLKPFCDELVKRGLDKKCVWLSETRADRLDEETTQMMYDGGCRRVLMGIESGSDLLLGNVNKTLTTNKVREGVANAHKAGIQTVGLFMLGLPGETPEMSKQTIEFAVDLDLDFAKFAITVPFPGSISKTQPTFTHGAPAARASPSPMPPRETAAQRPPA